VGSSVQTLKEGDHVVVSFNFCGECAQCITGRPVQCDTWVPRNLVGGFRTRPLLPAPHHRYADHPRRLTRSLGVRGELRCVPHEAVGHDDGVQRRPLVRHPRSRR
jgi:threonine dehydrogenase-like Zn-dependent dehydrogenase